MSVKEKCIRRLLRDAQFYMNNIDGDDPKDPIQNVKKAGGGTHPVDTFVNHSQPGKSHEDTKFQEEDEVCIIATY